MVDSGQVLLQLLRQSAQSSRYNAKSVVAALVLFLGGSILLTILFCFVRPHHSLIYGPKLKYPDKNRPPPPPLARGPFAWIIESMRTTEADLVVHVGIDGAVFIRFCKMLRNLFMCMTVFICGVGIPINVYYNMQSKQGGDVLTKSDALMLMTPRLLKGVPLIAHIALAYSTDLLVIFFLWKNYKAVLHMRRQAFMTKEYQRSLFMRTVLLTEIPRKYASDGGIVALLSRFKFTRPIQQANCGRDVKRLSKLLEQHKHAALSLESVLSKYLKPYIKRAKNGDLSLSPNGTAMMDDSKRPKCRPFKEDRTTANLGRHDKVDAIEYYMTKMHQLEDDIQKERQAIDDHKTLRYGFASYNTVSDCHSVVKAARDEQGKLFSSKGDFHLRLAPRAEDIIWKNIILSRFERGHKQLWVNLIFTAVTILWIVPNAFIGCFLSDLSRIGALSSRFAVFMDHHSTAFAIIQGVLSPIVTTLIFLVLPMIMRRLAQWQGKVTKNARERSVVKKMYIFFFFNNFLVFTLMSVVWNVVTQVVGIVNSNKSMSFNQVMDELRIGPQIASAMIDSSSFWSMYLLRANMAAVFDLIQVISLILKSFKSHFMAPTPRQHMLWTAPPYFDYAGYYIWLIFYATIALAFTSLQPIIFPIITLYLAFNVVLKKHTIMYVYKTKAESDGSFWPLLHNRLLFATFIGHLVILCIVWIQGGWKMAIAVCPLLVFVIAYAIMASITLRPQFDYFVPSTAEAIEIDRYDQMYPSWDGGSVLEERYQNPALYKPLLVPMIHARAQQFLPMICNFADNGMFEYGNGRRKARDAPSYGNDGQTKVEEMPRFDVVEEHDLDFGHLRDIAQRNMENEEFDAYAKQQSHKEEEFGFVDHSNDQPYGAHDPDALDPPFYQAPYQGSNDSLYSIHSRRTGHTMDSMPELEPQNTLGGHTTTRGVMVSYTDFDGHHSDHDGLLDTRR